MAKATVEERVIALAGLFQAAQAVTDLAKTGKCDEENYRTLVQSLFVFNPESTLHVYGNELAAIRTGLTFLANLSGNRAGADYTEQVRYAISMLAVQKQLSGNQEMLKTISNRLTHLNYKNEHFPGSSNDLASSISAAYQDTISKLSFRIQVNGNAEYLRNTSVSDRVRTMLFAGVRAAILWRQLGGTRLQLLFGRGEIEKTSKRLLANLPPATQH
jgi:high frequency lysogenization protein